MRRLPFLIVLSCWAGSLGWIQEVQAQEKSVQHTLAKKHFELGQQYYQTADYAKALVEFKQAYQLTPLPELAFNMGRCYEALNELDQALQYFRLYLDKKPEDRGRAMLEQRIKNIEKRLEQQRRTKQMQQEQVEAARQKAASDASQKAMAQAKGANTSQVPAAATEAPTSPDQPMSSGKTWRVPVGWTLVGVGAASLVTGIVFGSMVSSKNEEYKEALQARKTFDELQAIRDTSDQYQTIQIVTLVAGGVLAAAGGGLLIWQAMDHQKKESTATISFFPLVTERTTGGGLLGRF